jgi:hypothetical protein
VTSRQHGARVGPNLFLLEVGAGPWLERGFPMVTVETDVEWPSRPAKMTIGVVVFVLGILSGGGLAMWVMPPS